MRDFCFHLEFHNHNLIVLFFVLFSMVCALLLIRLLLVSRSFAFSFFCFCFSWNISVAFYFSTFTICYDDLRIRVLLHTPLLPLLVLLSQHLLLSSISDSVFKILSKKKIFNRKYSSAFLFSVIQI